MIDHHEDRKMSCYTSHVTRILREQRREDSVQDSNKETAQADREEGGCADEDLNVRTCTSSIRDVIVIHVTQQRDVSCTCLVRRNGVHNDEHFHHVAQDNRDGV